MIIPVSKKPDPNAPGTGNRSRTERVTTCSVINILSGDRCTAEALDAEADILICLTHAGRVLELIHNRAATIKE